MTTQPDERRRTPRHSDFKTDSLAIETTLVAGINQAMSARLLDVSQGGLGVAVASPLVVGDDVDVDGMLRRSGDFMLVRGRARVAHCSYQPSLPHFRAGLAFIELKCQKPDGTPVELITPPTDDRGSTPPGKHR